MKLESHSYLNMSKEPTSFVSSSISKLDEICRFMIIFTSPELSFRNLVSKKLESLL